jgi:RNA recognition motif-containing protein
MNITVGNISYQATEENLRTLFEAHGRVESVSLPRDRYADHHRGHAFVSI